MAPDDPRQYLNDDEETARLAQEGHQSKIWSAIPAIVSSVNLTAQTIEAQPAVQVRYEDSSGNINWTSLPKLLDVPICFPSAGGFMVSFPIEVGDEVLIVFASRCIDTWWS